MMDKVEEEIKRIIKKLNINCSVREFQDKVDWEWISEHQKLSEEFIREFEDKIEKDAKIQEKF